MFYYEIDKTSHYATFAFYYRIYAGFHYFVLT